MALDYLDKMIAKGMGRAVTVGTLTSGIVGGGAGTILLIDEPELIMAIPSGIVVRPVFCEMTVTPGVSTADSNETEALLAVDSLSLWSGDGTFTTEEPSNMRTSFARGSACRVGSAVTGALTTRNPVGTDADPVIDMELARSAISTDLGDTTGATTHPIVSLRYAPDLPEWLEGPCTLLGYFGGAIATVGGFITLRWVEANVSVMEDFAGV